MARFWTVSLLAAAMMLAGAPGQAAPLTAAEILGGFNAVVLGDFSSRHDVEGRLMVGGNLAGGATFFNQPRGGAMPGFGAVNVAGNVAAGTYNVDNGGSVVVGGTSEGRFNLNGGGTLRTGDAGMSAADFLAPLGALAGQLAALQANSAVTAGDLNNVAFNAVPDAAGRAVFQLSTSTLETFRNMVVNLNGADTVVINVTGSSFRGGGNFNAGADVNRHVIWNFFEATSLDFGFWHGSVLALNAAVTNSTPIEGTLVAASFNGNGELHDYGFAGRLPPVDPPVPVPEPASLSLMAVGLAALAAARRRRRVAA